MMLRPGRVKKKFVQQLELDFPVEAADVSTIIFGMFGISILVVTYAAIALLGGITVYEASSKLAHSGLRPAVQMLLVGSVMTGVPGWLGIWLANGVMLQKKLPTATVVLVGAFIAYPHSPHLTESHSPHTASASVVLSIVICTFLVALITAFYMSRGKRRKL
ncbi:hypothetical protein [Acidisoma sp.]|uniref:hypothetical protein n=1 Tax=Acidisoma sp. TaxID=1872115 RepID=UPI003B009660